MRSALCVLALGVLLVVPLSARAGTLVPGMTRVRVDTGGDDGGSALEVSFTVAGPETGPLKVGLLHGRHLADPVTVTVGRVARGDYRSVTARLPVDRDDPQGRYTIGIDGPHRRLAAYRTTIVRTNGMVLLVGGERKVSHSWHEQRDRDLRYAWTDTSDGHLTVELFLRIAHPGDPVTATFRRGRKIMCRDAATPMGAPGQVLDLRLTCRGPKVAKAPSGKGQGGGIPVVDDSGVYQDAASQPADDGDDQGVGAPLPLARVLAAPGAWRVEVRVAKRLRAVVRFPVTRHGVEAALRRPGPMKAARIRQLR